jgi:exonuclease VII small subunit
MELSKHCNSLLEEAEKSITILLKDSDGEMKEEEFKV